MKKKVLLVLALLVVAGAVFAQAPTMDKLSFKTTAGRSVVSPANKQISGAVVIPDTAPDGMPVQQVTGFRDITGITSIVFPASLRTIGSGEATRLPNLTSVTFLGQWSSGINAGNFDGGDLVAKYRDGGPGTYTRQPGGTVWTKVGGTVTCPTCGGTGVIHQ